MCLFSLFIFLFCMCVFIVLHFTIVYVAFFISFSCPLLFSCLYFFHVVSDFFLTCFMFFIALFSVGAGVLWAEFAPGWVRLLPKIPLFWPSSKSSR